MKKNILILLIGIIIGGIVFGSIVYAYSYTAKQVSFTPNDKTWNVSNVDAAINDLKSNSTTNFGDVLVARNAGTPTSPSRTSTLHLDKGKYIVVANYSLTCGSSAEWDLQGESSLDLVCSNCEKENLSSIYSNKTSTEKLFAYGAQYSESGLDSLIYKVTILEDDTSVSISSRWNGNYNYMVENILLQAIPIN